MCAAKGLPAVPPGQGDLAEITRLLADLNFTEDREVRLRGLSADMDQGLADVYLLLRLMAAGRASCSPDFLRRLAERMRGAAGSIDLLLGMLARDGGRQ